MKAVKELQKPGLFQTSTGLMLLHPHAIISGSCDLWVSDELSDEQVLERARPATPQRYRPSRLSPAPASPRRPRTRSAAARPASIAPSK